MKPYVLEAIDFLRVDLPVSNPLIAFSGGKDSIAMYEITKLAGIAGRLLYTFTTIDPPEIMKFIKEHYPECEFCKPKKSFWYMITTNNPPLMWARWCCRELKKRPSWKYPEKHRIMGIRAEESGKRAKYERVNYDKAHDLVYYYPIFHWKEWQVWEFIEEHGLPYPSLYDEGFARIGCIVCPYHTPKQNEIYKVRYPGLFKAFEKAVKKWFIKRVAQGRTMAHKTPEAFIQAWYRQEASWYKGG